MLNNKDELKQYIVSKLGAPILKVELANSQLDFLISDCIQICRKYNYGDGGSATYTDTFVFKTTKGKRTYRVADEIRNNGGFLLGSLDETYFTQTFDTFDPASDLATINRDIEFEAVINYSDNTGLLGTVGDPNFNMLWTTQTVLVSDLLASGGFSNIGNSLANLYAVYDQMDILKYTFEKVHSVQFNKYKQEFTILPTIKTNGTGILQVAVRRDDIELINTELFKDLVVAKAKIQWGTNLGKFNMNVPGSGTINYDRIITEGKEELEKTLELLKAESDFPLMYIA